VSRLLGQVLGSEVEAALRLALSLTPLLLMVPLILIPVVGGVLWLGFEREAPAGM
jgi:uncharacterized membrane protein